MKKYSTELKWATIFVVVTLVWMVLEKAVGLHGEHIDKHAIYTNLFAIPAIAVYVFALREKRDKDFGGTMTFSHRMIRLNSVVIDCKISLTILLSFRFLPLPPVSAVSQEHHLASV